MNLNIMGKKHQSHPVQVSTVSYVDSIAWVALSISNNSFEILKENPEEGQLQTITTSSIFTHDGLEK